MKQQQEWEAAVVMAVVCWERIGRDSGEDGCMHKCEDKKSGRAHCYYCHSLQLRGVLLS